MNWRFLESDEDGAAWLESPEELTAWVEYDAVDDTGAGRKHRIMVVTRSWMEKHTSAVRLSRTGPLFASFPALAVVPTARGEELRKYVDQAVQQGALTVFSTPVV